MRTTASECLCVLENVSSDLKAKGKKREKKKLWKYLQSFVFVCPQFSSALIKKGARSPVLTCAQCMSSGALFPLPNSCHAALTALSRDCQFCYRLMVKATDTCFTIGFIVKGMWKVSSSESEVRYELNLSTSMTAQSGCFEVCVCVCLLLCMTLPRQPVIKPPSCIYVLLG